MLGTTWLGYFEGNRRADCAPAPGLLEQVPRELRRSLAVSLGRFQLGEAAGGRLHQEIELLPDASLDPPLRRSVQLYIEEEWRHSRELAMIIGALGGELQSAHWTNGAFTACRRLLGLRTKMMTLAIAEVIGIVYYRALATGLGSASLATSLHRIANEESRHLDFQAAFFDHAVAQQRRALRGTYRLLLRVLMAAIFVAAVVVLLLDHGRLLRRVGARPAKLVGAAWYELSSRRFLSSRRLATPPGPRYAWLNER